MRNRIATAFLTALAVVLGCQSDQMLTPGEEPPDLSGLKAIALRVEVDVTNGTVRMLPAGAAAGARDSGAVPPPSFAILGTNEVAVTGTNLVRSAPVNNKVTVTFDAAITNRLTSASLVASTFPGTTAGTGLILFPFQVTQAVGGQAALVVASTDWNGDGSPGSGAPRNFFNDFGCSSSSATSDCFRWEQYPAPLGPGETTAPQKVGFTLPTSVTLFTVLLVLAADISNDLPPVARIEVTPPSDVMDDGFPATFSAVAYDARNTPLTWATLKWTSPDVTALAFQYGGALVGVIAGPSQIVHARRVGPTSFTVSSGGISVVVPVDIQVNTVALVQLYTPDSSVVAGEQIQGDARVKDHSGNIIPGFQPTWSTSDPNVLTVDQNGLITATGPGTADVIATAGLASARVTITVERRLTGSIAGTMRDLDGQPVKGANVRARGVVEVNTTTADDGSYAFTDLPIAGTPAGLYVVDWSPTGCVPGSENRIVLQVGGVVPLDISVDCPPRVSGVLTSVQGALPTGLTVELTPDAGGSNRVGAVQADGSYSISGFPAGGYFIFVNRLPANCTAPGAQSISLTQQAHYIKDWSVDCPAIGGLAGRVKDIDFQVVAGATVDARSLTDGQIYSTSTDASGAYLLNVPADQYEITLQKAGSCAPVTTTRTVPVGSPIAGPSFLDCPWHILGKVVALGRSPAGWIVHLPLAVPAPEHATVLSDGSYELVQLAYPNGSSGSLTLSLSGVPSTCLVTGGPFSVSITQQMRLQVPDFTVDCRPPIVQVLVTDGATNPNGQPLIGMDVRLNGLTMLQFGRTGQDGALFSNAEPGYSSVLVYSNISGCTGGSSSVTAQPGQQYRVVVPVSCSTRGALEGTIRTALGNPLVNVRVSVGPYTLTTDANGHWGVAGLSPGPLQVQRLDTPTGCATGAPIPAAVIPKMTLSVNETVNCNGF